MEQIKEGEREGKEGIPLSQPPLSFFGSRPISHADKIPKIPFLGLSLLPNPTEMLATQAIEYLARGKLAIPFCKHIRTIYTRKNNPRLTQDANLPYKRYILTS